MTRCTQLPPAARRAVEQAYATVEIADSVAQLGGHQVALIRGYSRRLQQAIDALEGDVVNSDRGVARDDRHPRQGGGRGAHRPASGHGHESAALAHAWSSCWRAANACAIPKPPR